MVLQLIIFQVVSIGVFIFLLRAFFYRSLNEALKRLKALQEDALIKETYLKEELERAKREAEAEVEKGKEKAKSLVDEAKKQAESLRSTREDQARKEREEILGKGKIELEKMRKKALESIDERAAVLAVEMIKYVFAQKTRENLQHELLKDILEEIKDLQKERFPTNANKVKVITSLSLKDSEKKELKSIISEKIGLEVLLEEELDENIIAGIILQIGEFLIDGSLKNKLQKVIPYLKIGHKE